MNLALAALVVFVVLIALVWLAVMRSLNDDGIPVRATLEEDGSIRKWLAEQNRKQDEHVTTDRRLGQAKDRNVARTWDSGL